MREAQDNVAAACGDVKEAYDIEWVKVTPPGGRAERHTSTALAKERLEILHDGTVCIRTRCYQDNRILVTSAVMTVVTTGLLIPWGPERWVWGVLSLFLWVLVFELLFQKDRAFTFDPRHARACYLRDETAICLELPNGRWLAVRARRPKEHEAILAQLRQAYGTRFFETRARPMAAGGPPSQHDRDASLDGQSQSPAGSRGNDLAEFEVTCRPYMMAPVGELAFEEVDERRTVLLQRHPDGTLDVRIPVVGTSPWLFVVFLTVATTFILGHFTEPWVFGPASVIVWAWVVLRFYKRRTHIRLEPRSARACHIREDRVVCVELPSGRWLGLRAHPFDEQATELLAAWLRGVYGTGMQGA